MSTIAPIPHEAGMLLAGPDVTRPCPFCGQFDKTELCSEDGFDENDLLGTAYWVACANCGAEGPKAYSPALAAGIWNHRTT